MNCTDLLTHLSDYFDDHLSPKLLERTDALHGEPGGRQPVADIRRVQPHVVALPERPLALFRRDD